MADEDKTSGADLVKIALVGGVVVVVGWGGYKLYEAMFGDQSKKDELYQTILKEYLSEVTECNDFYDTLVKKGGCTDLEREHLDFMKAQIAEKEVAMANLNNTYITYLANDLKNLAKTIGLYYVLPAALLVGGIYTFYFLKRAKKWPIWRKQPPPAPESPPPPPSGGSGPAPGTCPIDGETFADADALWDHMFMNHPVTTDVIARQQAQAAYNQLSGETRAMISVQMQEMSLTPPQEEIPWAQIGEYTLMGIAAAAAIVMSYGSAAPAMGGLLGGYSIQDAADQIAINTIARTLVASAV